MGCHAYHLDYHATARFADTDDVPCLCTFSHNYSDEKIDRETVVAMALLGAAAAIARNRELAGNIYLPHDLPQWIVREIKRVCGVE